MIASLFYPKNNKELKTWFFLHVALGFLGLISKYFVIIWIYLVLIQSISYVNSAKSQDEKHLRIINLLFYLAPIEIFTRIVNCSPFIPYEFGKYVTFFLLLRGLSFSKSSNKTGYNLILLLVPGIILGWPMAPDYRFIIFDIMGLINLGLGSAYFGGLYLIKAKVDMRSAMRLILYSLIAALIYTVLKTPDYDDIDFQLSANFKTSGGFGSNQVSTAFGLGLFISFYLWEQRTSFSGFNRFIDLALSGLFLFQGLLTFSRGGIIGGVLGIILYIIWRHSYSQTIETKNRLKNLNLGKIVFVSIPFLIMLTLFANSITNGNLLLRYQGETEGTLIGSKENDLNNFTTGRVDLFLEDLKIFIKYPIFGSGVSVSSQIRTYHKGVAAHVELSRLLAEHGIFGMIIFLMFLFKLFSLSYKREPGLLILLVLFVIGFYTTFHAATRTFLSPLLMSIAFLPLKLLKR